MNHFTFIFLIFFAAPAIAGEDIFEFLAEPVSVCGYSVVNRPGNPDNFDAVFYRVDELSDFYGELASAGSFTNPDNAKRCWAIVKEKIDEIGGVPGGFAFQPNGASEKFKEFFSREYRIRFHNNIPGAIPADGEPWFSKPTFLDL